MKTVVEPRKQIADLWGKQRIREQDVYRLMRYVLRVDRDGKVLLHNVVTGQLAVLSEEEAGMLEKLPMAYTSVMEQLVTEHYLVPEGFDEYKSVNQLRKIYQIRDTGTAINHYVILPTTFCNARCFYCYESDYPRVHMTEEIARKLIDYIDEHRQNKDVNLSWFGGEPLVGIQRIDQISQGLKDRGISFTSSMISNGYLFDERIIERSVKLWNLKRVQITLDGPESVYNRVKAYANAQDNPFQRVLRNIDMLIASGIHVNIRLNVEFYNTNDISILIEDLGKRYSGNKNINVYLSMLFNGMGSDPIQRTQNETIKLLKILDGFSDRLKELKLEHDKWKVPALTVNQCMADNSHTVVIQPDGGFCKCEHETIHDRYGSIEEGILDPQKPLRWKETIELSTNCASCSMYPSCYLLRYCINADKPCIDSIRFKTRAIHEERLYSIYQKSLEEEKNEEL